MKSYIESLADRRAAPRPPFRWRSLTAHAAIFLGVWLAVVPDTHAIVVNGGIPGVDDDGDVPVSRIDEEPFDGIDNDVDGKVDTDNDAPIPLVVHFNNAGLVFTGAGKATGAIKTVTDGLRSGRQFGSMNAVRDYFSTENFTNSITLTNGFTPKPFGLYTSEYSFLIQMTKQNPDGDISGTWGIDFVGVPDPLGGLIDFSWARNGVPVVKLAGGGNIFTTQPTAGTVTMPFALTGEALGFGGGPAVPITISQTWSFNFTNFSAQSQTMGIVTVDPDGQFQGVPEPPMLPLILIVFVLMYLFDGRSLAARSWLRLAGSRRTLHRARTRQVQN